MAPKMQDSRTVLDPDRLHMEIASRSLPVGAGGQRELSVRVLGAFPSRSDDHTVASRSDGEPMARAR